MLLGEEGRVLKAASGFWAVGNGLALSGRSRTSQLHMRSLKPSSAESSTATRPSLNRIRTWQSTREHTVKPAGIETCGNSTAAEFKLLVRQFGVLGVIWTKRRVYLSIGLQLAQPSRSPIQNSVETRGLGLTSPGQEPRSKEVVT